MTKKILLLTSITSISLMAQAPSNPEANSTIMTGIKHIKILGKALKTNVGKHLKEDPTGLSAVKFCSENAKDVAKKAMADFPSNITVRRTALRYRNPHNKPDATDTKVMRQIVDAIQSGTFNKKPIVITMEDNTTRVYAPLMVDKACTKCHGDPARMNPEVLKVIQAKYPEDKAIGFKEHDFRGVAVAEIRPK